MTEARASDAVVPGNRDLALWRNQPLAGRFLRTVSEAGRTECDVRLSVRRMTPDARELRK